MTSDIREAIAGICDRLTPAQVDDAVSRFENLSVLLDKVYDERDIQGEHTPGVDEHIHQLTHQTIYAMQETAAEGGNYGATLRNCLMQVFWFGYEAGKAEWPLKPMTCEEAHT